MPTPSVNVALLLGRFEGTLIVLAAAFVVWRICVALIDQIYARRFVSHHVPRVATFCTLSKSIAGFLVLVVTSLTLLHVWSVDIIPAVWSAGLVTAALAFGSQTIVRDVVTGFFFLFEDQYDVGDRVSLVTTGGQIVAGRVASMGLRTTTVLDKSGASVVVANGYIALVTNSARLPYSESFTLEIPWQADAGAMRQRVEAHAVEAAAAANAKAGQVSVTLSDVTAAGPVFNVEIRALGAGADIDASKMREALLSALQADGWLPRGGSEKTDVQ
jgi:small-conductance mechanosensitive channel